MFNGKIEKISILKKGLNVSDGISALVGVFFFFDVAADVFTFTDEWQEMSFADIAHRICLSVKMALYSRSQSTIIKSGLQKIISLCNLYLIF